MSVVLSSASSSRAGLGALLVSALLALAACPAAVDAYPFGPGSCDASGGHGPVEAISGYTLTHAGTLAPNEKITLTLTGAANFKGFLVTTDEGTLAPKSVTGKAAVSCAGGVGRARSLPRNRKVDVKNGITGA